MRAGRPRAARSRRVAARAAVRPGPIHQRSGRPFHPSRRELPPPPAGLHRTPSPPGSERGSSRGRCHRAEHALPPAAQHAPQRGAAAASRAPPDGWSTGQRARAITRPLAPHGARARSRRGRRDARRDDTRPCRTRGARWCEHQAAAINNFDAMHRHRLFVYVRREEGNRICVGVPKKYFPKKKSYIGVAV